MKIDKWLNNKVGSLAGQKIAITGSTGGLGYSIAEHIAQLGGELILVNRNQDKTNRQIELLREHYPNIVISWVPCDMESKDSVIAAAKELINKQINVLILNAGVYHIPTHQTADGWSNIFQINFASPYCLARILSEAMDDRLHIIAVSSIAMKKRLPDLHDPEGRRYIKPMQLYGYTKMLLSYGLILLDTSSNISIAHPGITYTNIMNNYSKVTNAIIRPLMRLIFPSPKRASRGIVAAISTRPAPLMWYSPRLFDIWCKPIVKKLPYLDIRHLAQVIMICNDIYAKYVNNQD